MKILDIAIALLGIKEGSKEHKNIIDTYNKQEKLPQGYKVKYTDSWCATFISYLFLVAGYKTFCFECSCTRMIELAKKLGLWIEDDKYTPRAGDCILYDWQDSGSADCKGTPDHIGIVENVTKSGIITVIEGNYHDAVGRRRISVNGRYIRGFIKSSDICNKIKKKAVTKSIVDEVISGKWGVGDDRKRRLEEAGYNYYEIQKKVNTKLKKTGAK